MVRWWHGGKWHGRYWDDLLSTITYISHLSHIITSSLQSISHSVDCSPKLMNEMTWQEEMVDGMTSDDVRWKVRENTFFISHSSSIHLLSFHSLITKMIAPKILAHYIPKRTKSDKLITAKEKWQACQKSIFKTFSSTNKEKHHKEGMNNQAPSNYNIHHHILLNEMKFITYKTLFIFI